MNAIQESQWNQVSIYTWSDLSQHQWECFRLALMESETELESENVLIVQSPSTMEDKTEMDVQGVLIVQSPIIMESKSEMVISIVVSDRSYKTEMLKYLPLYERKSSVFNEILDADDREFRNTEQELTIADRNMFIDTAIETLPIYERDLGIKTVSSLRYDQRREQIISRNIASFDQTTEETIKLVASAYSNGDVEVNETTTPGLYEIKFVGAKGIPNNIDGLKEALNIIIPAHLGLTYTFTFNAWEFWKTQTWGDVSPLVWNDLRIWDEVS